MVTGLVEGFIFRFRDLGGFVVMVRVYVSGFRFGFFNDRAFLVITRQPL